MNRKVLALFSFVFLLAQPAWADERPRITLQEAKQLVMAALTPAQRRLPSAQAEFSASKEVFQSERFVGLTAIWSGEKNGSVVIGVYDVDPYTGDVFSATAECLEYKNQRLSHLQKRIHTRLGLTSDEYKKIKTKGNMCG